MDFLASFLGGLLLVLFGLAVTFYGYGVFRLLLPIIGFVAGVMLGRGLFPDAPFWGWVFGIALALLFAFLAYAFWSILIAMSGAVLGFTMGISLIQMLGWWDWLGVVLGIVLAVVFGALYFFFRDVFVMVATGLVGAAITLYGLGTMFPTLLGFLKDDGNWLTFILALVLGIIGAGVQLLIFASMKYYSAEAVNTPPPYIITPSSTAPAAP